MSKHFQLARHPWLAMLAVMLAFPVGLILFSTILIGALKQPPDAQPTVFTITMLAHITVLFLLVPFVLKLPEGTNSFKAYLDAIRLSRGRPFFRPNHGAG